MKRISRIVLVALFFSATLLSGFGVRYVSAACPVPSLVRGQDSLSFTVASSGTYRIWLRLKTPDAARNSLKLQIDQSICDVTVGGSSLSANTWTWVNYQNGNTSSVLSASLTSGAHTMYLNGAVDGLQVDRVIMTQDTACIPTGTGNNCASAPTYAAEDINQDGSVNLLDFSLLASNYGKTAAASSNPRCDVNNDGQVNLLDFSRLASRYGT